MPTVAIITGGASGIGRALGSALVARGDTVVLADLDRAGAERTAAGLGAAGPGRASGAHLDVRDADAVRALVRQVRDGYGRLDLMVNNAGVGVGGEVADLTLAHWDRALEVNLRGVVHGVHAAYPVMCAQRSGRLVNVASLAGLVASPLLTPYAASKFAVVGLSLSLRAEAADRGVRVNVVCPGVIETPLLDSRGPDDLPAVSAELDPRAMLGHAGGRPYPAELLARDVLRGLARNRALIVAPARARAIWRLARWAPGLAEKGILANLRWSRRHALRPAGSAGVTAPPPI
jgi:NAD(P)-dependent dehydrogenase (short-subunit alcohol dehydrogenase family)